MFNGDVSRRRLLTGAAAAAAAIAMSLSSATAAEKILIQRIAGARIVVPDLEKTRQFYTGLLGLEEAFTLKDENGAVTSAFFKVNDEQYVEFAPGAVSDFRWEHLAMLTADLKSAAAELRRQGITPGAISKAGDGTSYFSFPDPDGLPVRFIAYDKDSRQAQLRGKALGSRRVSDHLQHVGLPADHQDEDMELYQKKFGMREAFRGGMIEGELRWINLVAPGTPGDPGDMVELMVLKSAPVQGRRHLAFEVPNMERARQLLIEHGMPARMKANAGPRQNPRWILNLRDPSGLRVEIMGETVPADQRK